MAEIKILLIDFIYLIFFEYATWQHDVGHYKLVISCMINHMMLHVLYGQQMKNTINSNT